ncbi:MAG: hypothetical protein KME28_13275 [Pelatocladus maniniholoensis HA4357-MV3]|jgi:hypothetical protein|uniref:Uncharacterized protein n=1 Tax=Pelatocladus maniniholoensis HA4357-MV3 TaxID=1117104 RepID=A0A9E3H8D0_9NOST|nr:hypothetical protein [Pelatocladus maniniholoensis HA4357-MV3]BAZ65523.1 hypothetical protein NIES4106_02620 [Fischerella sp. NIES-4106]
MTSKVYTTEDLIKILAAERQACLKGDRLKLEVDVSGNPVIDQFIRTDGLQMFTAYQDFKAAIHEYQKEYLVSGIIWREVSVKGKTLRYPEIDSQLIALSGDLNILKVAKNSILEFWNQVTIEMDLYLSIKNGKQYQQIIKADVDRIAHRTEWASICCFEKSNFLEIILQLGWGQPQEACYKRGFPTSGSEFIHAVNPGNHPIA